MSHGENKIISIRGAREKNLKNVNLDLEKNQLIVFTGLSGSGKSSLAFDTIYSEGRRRYVESLSSYARQFLNIQDKPDVDSITGLSPAIAIDQKTTSKNPRSTVATVTEIYDYLRLLFARIGKVVSPTTGKIISSSTVSDMISRVSEFPDGAKFYICAPIASEKKGDFIKEIMELKKQGYQRFKVDGEVYNVDDVPKLDKNQKHDIDVVVDRIAMSPNLGNRVADAIENAVGLSEGVLHVDIVKLPDSCPGGKMTFVNGDTIAEGETMIMSEKFVCHESNFTLDELEPRIFSFNSPFGACESCNGLGTELNFKIELVVPDQKLSLAEGAIQPWTLINERYYRQVLESLAAFYKFSTTTPFKDLDDEIKDIILYGSKGQKVTMTFYDEYRKYSVDREYHGVIEDLSKRMDELEDMDIADNLKSYQNYVACRSCNGYRLRKSSLTVIVNGLHIGKVTEMTIDVAKKWFQELPSKLSSKDNEIAKRIIKEISDRLQFLLDVGLDYLSLSRDSSTLSGGESQRIRLASQVGSGLSGVMYVLDEPSIGLHPCDNTKLIDTLKRLRDMGNTVIVVEHDEETMSEADYIVDIGPGAGRHGGNIVAQGTLEDIKNNPNSITGAFLSGRDEIETPKARRKYGKNQKITIHNAREHNLKNITVEIPLGMFVAFTGVSGGGKSTLVIDTLYKALSAKLNGASAIPGLHDKITGYDEIDKIIEIDQSPIGRTPRSNPATYIGAFNLIRDHFTALPESRARGYKPGRFSFNVKGGRCETCQGDGVLKIEMHFLPDVYIECDVCKGKRYNRATLDIKYRGKNISEILDMTCEEAVIFFDSMPSIKDKFSAMCNVGLGYIKIGQQATTLSGGEAQRVKLAKELCKRATGNTLYILDEPTTGLHVADIKKLLHVLHTLVDYGNSVIVIEHNLDVIKTADYVIDIGPKGGVHGGQIVATGKPEDIVKCKESVTGKYLEKYLKK